MSQAESSRNVADAAAPCPPPAPIVAAVANSQATDAAAVAKPPDADTAVPVHKLSNRSSLCELLRASPENNRVPVRRLAARAALTGVGLACVASIGIAWGLRWINTPATGPLRINESALNFGTRFAQSGFEWMIPISNHGDLPIAFELRASCPCTIVEEDTMNIPPGQTHFAKLLLDLTQEEMREDTVPFAVKLVALPQEGSEEIQSWVLRGIVRVPFTLTPSRHHLGSEIPRGAVIDSVSFSVHTFEPVSEVSARADSNRIAPKVEHMGGSSYRVTLSFSDDVTEQIGPISSTIHVTARDKYGARYPTSTFALTGDVVGPIAIVPAQIQLGLRVIGGESHGTFVIRSRGGEYFRLIGLTPQPTIDGPIVIPPTDSLEYRQEIPVHYTQRINSLGDIKHAIEVNVETRDGKERFRESVRLFYHGAAQRTQSTP